MGFTVVTYQTSFYLPLMVGSSWLSLVELGRLPFIKPNNQERDSKRPDTIALGVALQKVNTEDSSICKLSLPIQSVKSLNQQNWQHPQLPYYVSAFGTCTRDSLLNKIRFTLITRRLLVCILWNY